MFSKPSIAKLREQLKATDAAIAAHPLSSEAVVKANAIIESSKGESNDVINQRLTEKGLPDLEAMGRITLKESTGWWKLHRERNTLTKKIDKLSR